MRKLLLLLSLSKKKKLLIVSLMLLTSVTACSEGEKVYSFKTCESKSIDSDDCDKCKTSLDVKVKYKVNKSKSSVLQTITQRDGTSKTTPFVSCSKTSKNARTFWESWDKYEKITEGSLRYMVR